MLLLISHLVCRILKAVGCALSSLSHRTRSVLSRITVHSGIAIFDGVGLLFAGVTHRVGSIFKIVGFIFERRFLLVFLARIARTDGDQGGGENYRGD